MSELSPSYPLTPSETIFLNPDRFLKSAVLGYRALDSETKVNVNEFAQLVGAGTLLAMEAVGDIGLELEEYKRLIGKGKRVKITLLKDQTSFPIPSMEAVFFEVCKYLENSKKGANAKDVLWAALGKDDDHPWNKLLDSIPPHMAERGLLGQTEEKKLKIFTVTNYEMLDETRKLAQAGPVSEIQALLSSSESGRSDFWKQLKKDVYRGISARDSSSDDDFD